MMLVFLLDYNVDQETSQDPKSLYGHTTSRQNGWLAGNKENDDGEMSTRQDRDYNGCTGVG